MSRPGTRLYGAPRYIEGEALSAWFYRIAAAYRLAPTKIAKLLGWHQSPDEIDFLTKPDFETMAWVTASDPERLKSLYRPHSRKTIFPVFQRFLPITQSYTGSPIYRLCTRCIGEDTVPYVRWYWRLATTTICPTHANLLIDRCSHCKTLLYNQFLRFLPTALPQRARAHAIRYCAHCRADLVATKLSRIPRSFSEELLALQTIIIDGILAQEGKSTTTCELDFYSRFLRPVDSGTDELWDISWSKVINPRHLRLFFKWFPKHLDVRMEDLPDTLSKSHQQLSGTINF